MMGPMPDGAPDPLPLTARRVFGRAARRRCPVCGGGDIFRRWMQMAEHCPTCGFRFERIEGHWLGSLALNTVVNAFLVILVLVVGFALTYDDPSIPLLLTLTVGTAILGPLVLFPYTRTFWTAFDLLVRPLTPDDQVDVRYLPPARKPW